MEVVRTPEERFGGLAGFPFDARYLDDLVGFEGLRMARIDEGPREADRVFLCLHGEPTWSYLYRLMIPVFLRSGARVVAPDFFGFGRSDKPVDDSVYTYGFHRRSLIAFMERLGLEHVTLVVQDWGGILGLTLPMEMPGRIERLLIMNTALPTGDHPLGEGFESWRAFVAGRPDLDVGRLMQFAVPGLSDEAAKGYDAPFPDARYKAGVRRFPELVPRSPDMEGSEISKAALEYLGSRFEGQVFMAVGAQDPVLGPPVMQALSEAIRGCPEPMVLDEAGHFVQEDGERVAIAALKAFGDHLA
jgi:pimeloyl-ACP methyl ester carboxylesterase